jgi:hypothetical protein
MFQTIFPTEKMGPSSLHLLLGLAFTFCASFAASIEVVETRDFHELGLGSSFQKFDLPREDARGVNGWQLEAVYTNLVGHTNIVKFVNPDVANKALNYSAPIVDSLFLSDKGHRVKRMAVSGAVGLKISGRSVLGILCIIKSPYRIMFVTRFKSFDYSGPS